MNSTLISTFFIILISVYTLPANHLGYVGIILCFLLSALGTSTGVWTIANHVSGTSIKVPRVGTKSILGTVVCEANFLSGIIQCILSFNYIRSFEAITAKDSYLFFCSNIFVGMCSYFSSVSTGMICAVISMVDGKDPNVFFKVVILEIIPASVGLIGFILGIVMNSKAGTLQ